MGVAGHGFDAFGVALDAIGPEILSHDRVGSFELGGQLGQGRTQGIDGFHFLNGNPICLDKGAVDIGRQPRVRVGQILADADHPHDVEQTRPPEIILLHRTVVGV